MDSRVKTGSELSHSSLPAFVSILVLMDSRVKTPYRHLLPICSYQSFNPCFNG